MNKEKILVTGGTGFVGINLVRHLVELGQEVVVWGRAELETSSLKELKHKIKFVKINLLEEVAVKESLLKINPSFIVHLAVNNESKRDPQLIKSLIQDNCESALNIYNAARELKTLKGIIVMGSAAENEQNQTPFDEEQKEKPASPYGLSKLFQTKLSDYFFRMHSLPIIVLRPTQGYGPYQSKGLISYIITKCLDNETIDTTFGEQPKDFVYIKDIVRAITLIMENPLPVLGEKVNISTGRETKLKDLILLIKALTHSSSVINFGAMPYRDGEGMHFFASNKKAKNLLGWEPEYSLEQGLKETIERYRSKV